MFGNTQSRRALAYGVSLSVLACAAAAAQAQDAGTAAQAPITPADTSAPGAAADGSAGGQDIVVTGSRIASGFTTPTPVTVASAAQLRAAAPRNLADALSQLPAFNGSLGDQNSVTVPTVGTAGQALLNLRNLGSNRTLVLLDGRRLPPTNSAGAVDVDVLPQALVKRVDVVTGGASAAYGSDAVAGVVNFILDNTFQGLKGEVQRGVSTYGDLPLVSGSLTYGTAFAGDRGHLVASAEFSHQNGLSATETTGRKWYDVAAGQIPNPVTGGVPANLVISDIRSSVGTYGGLISSGPLKGTQFLPGGIPAPFNFGTITGAQFQSGGDGARANLALAPNIRRANAFAHGEFEVSPALTLFAEGSYARSHVISDNDVNPNVGSSGQFTIFRDNAYLPASILARMITANVQSIPVGRWERDFPLPQIDTLTRMVRGSGGVKGNIGGPWNYDASYTYGETRQRIAENNLPIVRNLYAAADAVVNPANGQIVCRSTLMGLDPGCQPLNIFGEGSPSQAAINYIIGDSIKYLRVRQQVAAINIRGNFGDKFQLGAGPISIAIGGEYRRESANQTTDPISPTTVDLTGIRGGPASLQGRAGGYQSFNPVPLAGRQNIKEGYAEIGVPVLKDLPFAEALDLNAAVRHTDYSLSGGVTTWKGGVNYQVVDFLRFRLTRSRDIRGPNILELFNGATYNNGTLIFKGSPVAAQIISSGNASLSPERADTLTYGTVIRVPFIRGLQASVDRYDISIKQAIATQAFQTVLDNCSAGVAAACALVTVTSSNTLILHVFSQNLNVQKATGYDFEINYARPAFGGQISLRLLTNLTTSSYLQAPGTPIQQLLGATVNPKWKANLQARYVNDRWSAFVQERYIGHAHSDPTKTEGVDINDNSVPHVYYTDIGATADVKLFGQPQEFFLSVNNLFNKAPPIVTANASNFSVPTTAAYDQIGRFFTVGIRFKI